MKNWLLSLTRIWGSALLGSEPCATQRKPGHGEHISILMKVTSGFGLLCWHQTKLQDVFPPSFLCGTGSHCIAHANLEL